MSGSFMAELGARLVDNGFAVIPIMPGAKVPGRYRDDAWHAYPDWSRHCDRPTKGFEIDIWRRWPGCAVGIACGAVVGVDIDVLVPEIAFNLQQLAFKMLGDTPALRIGLAPKKMLVYRAAAPFAGIKRHPIEILARGQQFVAYAIHPDTGRPYDWPNESLLDVALEDLPVVDEARCRAFAEAAWAMLPPELQQKSLVETAPRSEWAGPSDQKGTREAIESALAWLPNDDLHWDDWFRVGMALKGALGDEGRDLWLAWSKSSSKSGKSGKSNTAEKLWKQAKPHSLGAGTIYWLAEQKGWKPDAHLILNGHAAELADGPHPAAALIAKAATTTPMPAWPADEPWPTPIDFLGDDALTGPPELRPDHLPAALAGFVFDTASRMGVDPAAMALCCIVAACGAISEEWMVQPRMHDTEWVEGPRLWGAIVGSPSVRKTPLLAAATRPFDLLDEQARHRHAEELRLWKSAVAQMKKEKTADEGLPAAPRLDRHLVEGTTVEALTEILRDDDDARQRAPLGKVLIRHDELSGWIADLDRYKAGGRGGGDRAAYLRLFGGGRHVVDRIGRGSFACPSWAACLLGGIQPEPIQRIARDGDDDGLLQRFLLVVPAGQAEGEDRAPDHQARERYHALFPALVALRPARAALGRPQRVVFHRDAHKHREAVNAIISAQLSFPDTSPRLGAALGKWPGVYARLALAFHLIEIADARARQEREAVLEVIRPATAERATRFMAGILLPHLLRADRLLFETRQSGHAAWVAGHLLASEEVRRTGRVAARDLQRAYPSLRAPEQRQELQAVMAALEVAAWVRAEVPANRARPITAWLVNPMLHACFADRAEAEHARRAARRAEAQAAFAKARQLLAGECPAGGVPAQ